MIAVGPLTSTVVTTDFARLRVTVQVPLMLPSTAVTVPAVAEGLTVSTPFASMLTLLGSMLTPVGGLTLQDTVSPVMAFPFWSLTVAV